MKYFPPWLQAVSVLWRSIRAIGNKNEIYKKKEILVKLQLHFNNIVTFCESMTLFWYFDFSSKITNVFL